MLLLEVSRIEAKPRNAGENEGTASSFTLEARVCLTGWLGRRIRTSVWRDQKSSFFRILINGHSEKSREFDSNSIRRLADTSECKTRSDRAIISYAALGSLLSLGIIILPFASRVAGVLHRALQGAQGTYLLLPAVISGKWLVHRMLRLSRLDGDEVSVGLEIS